MRNIYRKMWEYRSFTPGSQHFGAVLGGGYVSLVEKGFFSQKLKINSLFRYLWKKVRL